MAASGLQRFSINAVIREGGFSKGSFFFHFEGMDALCCACHERVRASMMPLPDSAGCRDLRGFLQEVGGGSLLTGNAKRWFTLARFFEGYAAMHPELGATLFDLTELLRHRLSKDVARLAGRNDDRAADIATYLSIALAGIAEDRAAAADPAQAARLWSLAAESAVAALEPPAPAIGTLHAGGAGQRKPH
jgi:AcrR family transcriptional regulator